ncbi:MAG: class I SAM-dependent methyltransferase [Lachnospiraceae bacterium]|nr:class I SAM-dependent methyltransferase [Lachnospiraceae bacterium]
MTEQTWDQKLNINTIGRDDRHADQFHHPYEPTPYCVLERLQDSGYITAENTLVDYGCGKGRVGFFLTHEIGCNCIGLEYDPPIFEQAKENLVTFLSYTTEYALFQKPSDVSNRLSFLCENAEKYKVTDADCFYFFNPFTVEILRSVMQQIIGSYYENPRPMKLFFYYPDPEYVSYLLTGDNSGMLDDLYFLDEIDCRDLFEGNDEREKIMIFEPG